jgi:hypothetical protein
LFCCDRSIANGDCGSATTQEIHPEQSIDISANRKGVGEHWKNIDAMTKTMKAR